jgi:hypothetical protein
MASVSIAVDPEKSRSDEFRERDSEVARERDDDH